MKTSYIFNELIYVYTYETNIIFTLIYLTTSCNKIRVFVKLFKYNKDIIEFTMIWILTLLLFLPIIFNN